MGSYDKYDLIAGDIRAQVNRYKYGSATRASIVQLLRLHADRIEREDRIERNNQEQGRLT